jgi:DNA/RNA endonuclease YhcR with UshA esterase domain
LTREATDKLKQAKLEDPVNHFKGKTVRVTGLITVYRGKPQIKVEDAGHVQVVERKKP